MSSVEKVKQISQSLTDVIIKFQDEIPVFFK